jgi:hypothetical protein
MYFHRRSLAVLTASVLLFSSCFVRAHCCFVACVPPIYAPRNDKRHLRWGGGASGQVQPPPQSLTRDPERPASWGARRAWAARLPADPEPSCAGAEAPGALGCHDRPSMVQPAGCGSDSAWSAYTHIMKIW